MRTAKHGWSERQTVLTLDIFIHLDAVDRDQWHGAPDDRPLTELGRQQAERIAHELGGEPLQGIYSSQALRCRASLAPLSGRVGLPVVVLTEFQDTADKALGALREIHASVPNGRAVLCSYGDVVPALLGYLAKQWGSEPPRRDNRKGVVFTLRYDGEHGSMTSRGPSPEFPV
jgi:8-oxo-dGTP diphosphatase